MKSHRLLALFLLSVCTNGVYANEPTTPDHPLIGITKAKPDIGEVGKAQPETTTKKSDNGPAKSKLAWVPETRKAGTFTIKPLTVNFNALTIGMSRKDQQINGFPINGYRSSFPGYLSNRTDRAGVGYDLELGIMATDNIEAFTILGVSRESPISKIDVAVPPFTPPFTATNVSIDFKPRLSFQVSLGGRYYWNTQKPWFPFVGLMGTATLQGAVKTEIFNIVNVLRESYSDLGPLTLQKRTTLLGGTLLAGADYQFNAYTALTLWVGLRYTPRTRIRNNSIAGVTNAFAPGVLINGQLRYRDNRSLWSLPIFASLKFTF